MYARRRQFSDLELQRQQQDVDDMFDNVPCCIFVSLSGCCTIIFGILLLVSWFSDDFSILQVIVEI